MAEADPHPPFISRVRLWDYKSIQACDVRLGPLTILVGPNGSGKSNFLDALAFLARALATTPAEAIDERGGMGEILRRVPDQADAFGIAIEAVIGWPRGGSPLSATYELAIGSPERRGLRAFEVIRETCALRQDETVWKYSASRGRLEIANPDGPVASRSVETDSLYLPAADQVYGLLLARLRRMLFCNFDAETMRQPQRPAPQSVLGRDGEHLADVLKALAEDAPDYKHRIDSYLRAIVPGLTNIESHSIGGYSVFGMRADTGADGGQVEFGSSAMSDGTIRAAGVLAAIFQWPTLNGQVPLVGIEEPETALHPAAAGVLFDALTEASEHVQVLATSQSADLLDREDLDLSVIRPAAMSDGLTVIGEVDDASREIVEKKLYTLGELMRGNQLSPEPADGAGEAGT